MNPRISNEFTACETYGSYTIVVRGGTYSAFSMMGTAVPNTSAGTRVEVRRLLDAHAARNQRIIRSGDIPFTDGSVFKWMLQGDRTPQIYGWVERDFAIVKSGGFWRTPDPDEAARRAAAAFDLELA